MSTRRAMSMSRTVNKTTASSIEGKGAVVSTIATQVT